MNQKPIKPKTHRHFETRLEPGETLTLDTGIIIKNTSDERCKISVRTPVNMPKENREEPIKQQA